MKSLLFLLVALMCFCGVVSAQWSKTASNLLGPLSQSEAAISSANGVVWAGSFALWSSSDQGLTWTQNSLPVSGTIVHIYFLDRNNGLVTSKDGIISKTSDGGKTWSTILQIGSATSACFLDNTNNILVSQFQPGAVHFSRDGGKTWGSVQNNNWIREIVPVGNGKAFLLSGDWPTEEHVWVTTDYGADWTEQPGKVNADSYSFDIEACNSNTMVIANEGYSNTADYDGRSRLWLSTDEGLTWNAAINNTSKFFAGSVSEGPHTFFAQTVAEIDQGFFRSRDNGKTWTNIGGPSANGDSRLIGVIDDNHIVSSDVGGNIWVTSNSGGDSIALPQTILNTSQLLLSQSASITQKLCNQPVDTVVPISIAGCGAPTGTLDSLWITGSQNVHITDNRSTPRLLATIDSIVLSFQAMNGPDTAMLHLRYNIGSGDFDTIVTIIGRLDTSLHPAALTTVRSLQFAQTSCASVDSSVPIGFIGCGTGGMLDSVWISGSSNFQISDSRGNPRTFAVNDSVRLRYSGTQGSDTAYLSLQYNFGSGSRDTSIELIGSTSPLVSHPEELHRESASAYMNQFDSLPMEVDINSAVNLDSIWPYLHDIEATYSWDSSIVHYYAYNPPSGWTLTSLSAHGNSADVGIHNNSGAAVNPLNLGTAIFQPSQNGLATTWVELPQLTMEIGTQSISLCVTQNEDNHWAVKTLGTLSGVEANVPNADIVIYPNPASNELFICNPYSNSVAYTIFDAIGRILLRASASPASTSLVDISSFPMGTYSVVYSEGGRVTVHKIDKLE